MFGAHDLYSWCYVWFLFLMFISCVGLPDSLGRTPVNQGVYQVDSGKPPWIAGGLPDPLGKPPGTRNVYRDLNLPLLIVYNPVTL